MRVDQNGDPVAAIATFPIEGDEEDVSERTVTEMGPGESPAGLDVEPGAYVVLKYS